MRYSTLNNTADSVDIIDFANELREFIDKGDVNITIDIHTKRNCNGCDKCKSNQVNEKAEILRKLADEFGADFVMDVARNSEVLMSNPKVFEEVFRIFVANYHSENPSLKEVIKSRESEKSKTNLDIDDSWARFREGY